MRSIPTHSRVAATLSKGRKRLPFALFLLLAGVVLVGWQLASSPNKPSTQSVMNETPLPFGSGTFDIKLNEGGTAQ